VKKQEKHTRRSKKKQQQKTSEARSRKQEAGSRKKMAKDGERGEEKGDLTAARWWSESAAGSLAPRLWKG